jgi:hypothetical protein
MVGGSYDKCGSDDCGSEFTLNRRSMCDLKKEKSR